MKAALSVLLRSQLTFWLNMGALISTYTILGPPSYNYNNGPQNPILIIKAPILSVF